MGEITYASLKPRPGHVVDVAALPGCDICKTHRPAQNVPATWDCPTIFGSWANLCDICQPRYGAYPGRTGVGIGQRLIVRTVDDV